MPEKGSEHVRRMLRQAERNAWKIPAEESAAKVAAKRHEAQADKSLRPGTPEWRRKVAQRKGGR